MSELHDYELPNFEVPEPQTFTIDNDAKADWALRKLASIRGKIAENTAIAGNEIERISAWLESQTEKLKGDAQYFEALLTGYGMAERANENRKTIDLPHGKVKSRLIKAKVEVTDTEAFIAWARESQPALIRVKESPNISALTEFIVGQEVVTEDGEIVPAVQVIQESINFTIETE